MLKVPLDSLLVWASSGGSDETARMRRLAWTFAARIGDKYQIRLTRPNCNMCWLSQLVRLLVLVSPNMQSVTILVVVIFAYILLEK